MNYKQVMLILGILTCIGTPLGLWIKMRVNSAEHALLIESNTKDITELRLENAALRKELSETKVYFEGQLSALGDKVDEVPQKTLNLLNSVNAIRGN